MVIINLMNDVFGPYIKQDKQRSLKENYMMTVSQCKMFIDNKKSSSQSMGWHIIQTWFTLVSGLNKRPVCEILSQVSCHLHFDDWNNVSFYDKFAILGKLQSLKVNSWISNTRWFCTPLDSSASNVCKYSGSNHPDCLANSCIKAFGCKSDGCKQEGVQDFSPSSNMLLLNIFEQALGSSVLLTFNLEL